MVIVHVVGRVPQFFRLPGDGELFAWSASPRWVRAVSPYLAEWYLCLPAMDES